MVREQSGFLFVYRKPNDHNIIVNTLFIVRSEPDVQMAAVFDLKNASV